MMRMKKLFALLLAVLLLASCGAETANTDICKKWWEFMAPIMETNPDNSPVSIDLQNVFHLD
jgi:L-rhamnose mutarotase